VELGNGDPAARNHDARSRFRSLYESTFAEIYAFVARSQTSGSDTDDVVAESYLAAWRRINDVPIPPNDRLWMYGVARNTLARFERSRRRQGRLFSRLSSQTDAGPPTIEPSSSHSEVTDAVTHLPKKEREVIQLIYWDGLSQDEAATVVGCSTNALRIRLHRAKKRLSRRLGIVETVSAEPLPIDFELETPK
jgi:RNA polymerase sigma factor (sigma-70 family)